MRIVVVGLGKIGLPLAAQFASKGHSVVGIDINQNTVDSVNSAREPFPGEAGLREALEKFVPMGRLSATCNYKEAIPNCDVVVVVVPLLVDSGGQPDFGALDSATRSIAGNLVSGTLICYETTLPIGTTRNRWKPMLQEFSGLHEGVDFHLVFSPERVLTGRVFEDLRAYPKLFGALNKNGALKAIEFYTSVSDFQPEGNSVRREAVIDLGSTEAAEMAKLAETTYRDVNIALANQFAQHAGNLGIDIYKVIEACNTQPYSHIHQPGISVGGHCIPVYPHLYLATHPEAHLVRQAREINVSMPEYAVKKLCQAMGGIVGQAIVVLGVSYRAGVKETAFSGVFSLVEELQARGAQVSVLDPLFSDSELNGLGLLAHEDGLNTDCLVLHTDHPDFLELNHFDFPNVKMILDGRNFLMERDWPEVTILRLGAG